MFTLLIMSVNTPESWSKFRKLRNKSVNAVKEAKQGFKDNLTNKINSGSISGRDWWKTFISRMGKGTKTTLLPLIKDDKSINDPTEKANALNQTILNDINTPVSNLKQPNQTLNNIVLELDGVSSVLKSPATGKASGPDLLNNRILKELADVISAPLTDLFNSSFFSSILSEIWKQANVTPIHKKIVNLTLKIIDPYLISVP